MTVCSRVTISALAVAIAAVFLSNIFAGHEDPLIFSNGSSIPSAPLPSTLTNEQRQTFRETGVLFLPGLLQGNMLSNAVTAAEDIYGRHSIMDLLFAAYYSKTSLQEWRNTPALARVAFESSMSSISADLLGETKSMRILKDALFGQTGTGVGCGFHVDDKGFWPAEDDSSGVNFWIALSDYNAETGGGIRVAAGSHMADWAMPCRDVVLNGTIREQKTCRMSELSPDCDAKLNEISVIYDMKPGDAILWDRWTFHRQEPFKTVVDNEHKLRYTVRYAPSDARAAANGLLHASVQPGKPFDTPYHPQVWPAALEHELKAIHQGLGSDFSVSKLASLLKESFQ